MVLVFGDFGIQACELRWGEGVQELLFTLSVTSTHKIAESSFVLIFFSAINLPGSLHWTQEPAILCLQNYCLQPTSNSQKPTAKQQQPTAKQPTSPSHSKHLFLFHFLLLDLHEFFIIIYYLFIIFMIISSLPIVCCILDPSNYTVI